MGDKDSEQNALVDILVNPSAEAKELPFSLLEDITAKFSNEREIGRGTFGVVYKGELRNGMKVAVKRLKHFGWILDQKPYPDFYAELDCLKKLKNKNIVRLLGYCVHIEIAELMVDGKKVPVEANQERLLCFEFVPHGTVQKAGASHGAEWPKRYQIINGICHGLEYIHNAKYLHLDLKPDNILLDENMEPKITDFGVSRFFGDQSTHDTIRSTGTRGYMAPEYINKGTVSEKTDIYSLGVVIFELVTGSKGPDIHESTQKQKEIFLKKELLDWDRSLRNSHTGRSLELAYQQVETCIKIALNCTDLNRDHRPSIKEIAYILDLNMKRSGDHVQQNCNFRTTSNQSEIRTYWMKFENRCCNDKYLMRDITADDGSPIKVAIYGTDNRIITHGPLSSMRVKIVVLDAMIKNNHREQGNANYFRGKIVSGRFGKPPLFSNELYLRLENGVANLYGARFQDDSSFVPSEKFKLGVMAADDSISEKIQEGISESFAVKATCMTRTYRMKFENSCCNDKYSMRDITADDGSPIKVAIYGTDKRIITHGPLSSVRVKIVVLDGDFNNDHREQWNADYFRGKIVYGRTGEPPLFSNELYLRLESGVANIDGVKFQDNSSFVPSKKFQLGVMAADDSMSEKIQEGISESFAVKDGLARKEPYPLLSDQVYKLRKIAINGERRELLEQMGIKMVQDFLWSYNKDKNSLRKKCGNIPDHDWDIIVGHALNCKPGRKQYSYYIQESDATIFLNSLYIIMGATFSGIYTSYKEFNKAQEDLVESYRTIAYDNLEIYEV